MKRVNTVEYVEGLFKKIRDLEAENESLRKDARRFRFIVDCPIRTHVALGRLACGSDDFDLAAECDRLNRSPENP